MRTHAEVLAEIDRIRREVEILAEESAEVGDADDEGFRGSSLGRPPQVARRAQKKLRSGASSPGNHRSMGRGRGKGKCKGKGKGGSGSCSGKGGKQSARPSSKSTHGGSDVPGFSSGDDERQTELDTPRTDKDSDGL